jgi:hypothetical protein
MCTRSTKLFLWRPYCKRRLVVRFERLRTGEFFPLQLQTPSKLFSTFPTRIASVVIRA